MTADELQPLDAGQESGSDGSLHDLRHTFASLLIQNGEPLAYVKDQLGHSSIKLTADIYGHLVPGANREAMDRLPTLEEPSLELLESGQKS